MPTPPRRPGELSGNPLSRRAALGLLAGAVGAAAAGCTSGQGQPGVPRRRRTGPGIDPDVAVAAQSLEEQETVLALVEATLQRHRALTGVLAPVAATHRAHVAVLRRALPAGTRPSSPPPSPASSPPSSAPSSAPSSPPSSPRSSPPSAGGRAPSVPRAPGQALRQVVVAEQDLRTSTKQHAETARGGAFARVLGSMAAAAAQQAVVLASSAGGKGRP